MFEHGKRLLFVIGVTSFLLAGNPCRSEVLQQTGASRMSQLSRFELMHNPAEASQESKLVPLEHVEIPLSLLRIKTSAIADARVRQALVFRRDGQDWVRWIFSPLDDQYRKSVTAFLQSKGLSTEVHRYFRGYETASRSVLVIDPNSGFSFSIKGPTNRTRGMWSNKPLSVEQATRALALSDYMQDLKSEFPSSLNGIEFLPETFGMSLRGVDQALLVREYPTARLLPLFSFFDEELGRKIAAANGYSEPMKFILGKLLPLYGESIGRLSALSGLANNSAHGQNYLLEVTEDLRLTGRIFMRDFSDARVNARILEAHGRTELLKRLSHLPGESQSETSHEFNGSSKNERLARQLDVNLAPLHSIRLPTWFYEGDLEQSYRAASPQFASSGLGFEDVDSREAKAGLPDMSLNYRLLYLSPIFEAFVTRGAEAIYGSKNVGASHADSVWGVEKGVSFSSILLTLNFPEKQVLAEHLQSLRRSNHTRNRCESLFAVPKGI